MTRREESALSDTNKEHSCAAAASTSSISARRHPLWLQASATIHTATLTHRGKSTAQGSAPNQLCLCSCAASTPWRFSPRATHRIQKVCSTMEHTIRTRTDMQTSFRKVRQLNLTVALMKSVQWMRWSNGILQVLLIT